MLEIYGGLVNVVSGQTGVFANVAKEVVAGFDDWVAKIDLFMEHESNTGKLLQDGVGFLHQFEQAVDNVAVALSHLLDGRPGDRALPDGHRGRGDGCPEGCHGASRADAGGGAGAALVLAVGRPDGRRGIANLLNPLRAMSLGLGEVTARTSR